MLSRTLIFVCHSPAPRPQATFLYKWYGSDLRFLSSIRLCHTCPFSFSSWSQAMRSTMVQLEAHCKLRPGAEPACFRVDACCEPLVLHCWQAKSVCLLCDMVCLTSLCQATTCLANAKTLSCFMRKLEEAMLWLLRCTCPNIQQHKLNGVES